MDDSEPFCRFCFGAEETAADKLFSPCACAGTQRWVHSSCLASWRKAVLDTDPRGAWKCGVCGSRYDAPLQLEAERAGTRKYLARSLRCVAVVAVIVSAFPLPVSLCMLLLCGVVARMGLSLVLHDGVPGLMYQGDPVPDVHSGVVLVASPQSSSSSPFHHTVVLLLEHRPSECSYGVVVNRKGTSRAPGWGGPVAGEQHFPVLSRIELPGYDQVADMPGLWWSHGAQAMQTAQQHQQGDQVIVLRGWASWAPRQLDGEVRRGFWLHGTATSSELLAGDRKEESVDVLWRELSTRFSQPA